MDEEMELNEEMELDQGDANDQVWSATPKDDKLFERLHTGLKKWVTGLLSSATIE